MNTITIQKDKVVFDFALNQNNSKAILIGFSCGLLVVVALSK